MFDINHIDEFQEGEVLVTNTEHDMFCPGIAMLPDGRLLVNGGGEFVRSTSIYDFETETWSDGADMNFRRWYNSSLTLGNGESRRVFLRDPDVQLRPFVAGWLGVAPGSSSARLSLTLTSASSPGPFPLVFPAPCGLGVV